MIARLSDQLNSSDNLNEQLSINEKIKAQEEFLDTLLSLKKLFFKGSRC